MPVYDYLCQPCEAEFSDKRPMAESDETSECPKCGQEAERTVSRGTSFVLKGLGWAADGYVNRASG